MVKMDNNNLFAQDDDEDFTKEGGKRVRVQIKYYQNYHKNS